MKQGKSVNIKLSQSTDKRLRNAIHGLDRTRTALIDNIFNDIKKPFSFLFFFQINDAAPNKIIPTYQRQILFFD